LLLTFHFVVVFVLNETLGGIFGFYRFCWEPGVPHMTRVM
jgi:hypothetical protein